MTTLLKFILTKSLECTLNITCLRRVWYVVKEQYKYNIMLAIPLPQLSAYFETNSTP